MINNMRKYLPVFVGAILVVVAGTLAVQAARPVGPSVAELTELSRSITPDSAPVLIKLLDEGSEAPVLAEEGFGAAGGTHFRFGLTSEDFLDVTGSSTFSATTSFKLRMTTSANQLVMDDFWVGEVLQSGTGTIALRTGLPTTSTLSDIALIGRAPGSTIGGASGASSTYRASCATSTDEFPNSITAALSGVINGTVINTNTRDIIITPTTSQDSQHAIGEYTMGPRDWLICQLELGNGAANVGGICAQNGVQCEAPSSSNKNLDVRLRAKVRSL